MLKNIVILCFERRSSKQNSVVRLKSNILPPPKFLVWLRHWSRCYITVPQPGGQPGNCPPKISKTCLVVSSGVQRFGDAQGDCLIGRPPIKFWYWAVA